MKAEVLISCLCGQISEAVWVDTMLEPGSVACHCDTCRQTTGAPFYATLPLTEQPKCVEGLSQYNSSDKVSRFFCGNCGSHICHSVHDNNAWCVATGVIEQVLEDEQVSSCRLMQIVEHQFVADTVDGGLAVCLNGPPQNPPRFYMHANDEQEIQNLSRETFTESTGKTQYHPQLRAACHCGGVEFFLSRPNERSSDCSSPWPDLLSPYHSCDPANPKDVKWWLRGSDKYLAGLCACRTCRLDHSSAITCWAFIPNVNLTTSDGTLINSEMGTLQSYSSSQGRTRTFCKTCGASVFLRIDERPDLLDISVGLFRAPEGVRAETWFEWADGRVSFAEEAVHQDLIAVCGARLKQLNFVAKEVQQVA